MHLSIALMNRLRREINQQQFAAQEQDGFFFGVKALGGSRQNTRTRPMGPLAGAPLSVEHIG